MNAPLKSPRESGFYTPEEWRAFWNRVFAQNPDGHLNINSLDPYEHRTEQFDHLELERNESGIEIEVYEERKQRGL
jgi:hypothetical protein